MKNNKSAPDVNQGVSGVISRISTGQFLQTVSVISAVGDLSDLISWTQSLVQLI